MSYIYISYNVLHCHQTSSLSSFHDHWFSSIVVETYSYYVLRSYGPWRSNLEGSMLVGVMLYSREKDSICTNDWCGMSEAYPSSPSFPLALPWKGPWKERECNATRSPKLRSQKKRTGIHTWHVPRKICCTSCNRQVPTSFSIVGFSIVCLPRSRGVSTSFSGVSTSFAIWATRVHLKTTSTSPNKGRHFYTPIQPRVK